MRPAWGVSSVALPQFLIPQWGAPPTVHAAFTLRAGGVSVAPFDSLNLGVHVGDDPVAVAENRRRVGEALALPAAPLWLEQVHGADVFDTDRAGVESALAAAAPLPPRADAIIVRRPGVVCCIQVADCLPVLLAARDGSVIAAAHAGWRGLAAGVLENAVGAMTRPAAELVAWLGPAIGPTKFEVGAQVREAFVSRDLAAAQAFAPNERGRWMCDLRLLAQLRLAALGVPAVDCDRSCTATDPQRFFSHRRDGNSGRMAALIWLTSGTC